MAEGYTIVAPFNLRINESRPTVCLFVVGKKSGP